MFSFVLSWSDGIVAEVLFWTVRRCLGVAYDKTVHNLWVKVVSRMLKIMVPVAGEEETITRASPFMSPPFTHPPVLLCLSVRAPQWRTKSRATVCIKRAASRRCLASPMPRLRARK